MKKEFIISDFKEAVKQKELLTDHCTEDLWEVVSYETANISGSLLIASQDTFPQPVTIEPDLEGWYKIFVCMTAFEGQNSTFLQLTDDEFSTHLKSGSVQEYVSWHPSEQVEEVFWKAADMTGQDITISKVDFGEPHTANICCRKSAA